VTIIAILLGGRDVGLHRFRRRRSSFGASAECIGDEGMGVEGIVTVQGERPALLSCQDAHFSKNSQEGGKFGRKSYEDLLPVFSPSCKFRRFFLGFTP
jgi:hypothetical protein